MANTRTRKEKHGESVKERLLYAAAKLFLENGYDATTIKGVAATAGISYGSVQFLYPLKEDILCELVRYVLEGQFNAASKFLRDKTDDKVLFYAAETTMQLYMAESGESIRNLYGAAYSMPKSSEIIQLAITEKVEQIFGEYLPGLKTQDFYMLEIASGGIIRSFMTVPCNMWFTMDLKVKAFLETTLRVYQVPQEKINEAIEFVKQFDFVEIAKQTIATMYQYLEDMSTK